MDRIKWRAMDWYSVSNVFMFLGFYLSFVAPLSQRIPWLDIPASTAVIMGMSCWLIVILQRLEALLEQISHIDFERVLSFAQQTEEQTESD